MIKHIIFGILVLVWAFILIACVHTEQDTLFKEMPVSHTNVNFSNQLNFDEKFNIFTYRNFYNGGGVALGDINNDGLIDIYLTANMQPNHLYLNKGNLQFEDITEKAGVAGKQAWSTGVSMADINGDGLLDIYVCSSGDLAGDNKQNELFINNGDLTFSERAVEFGVDDRGYTTHAAFFDYDKDGDLDLYILNNSYQAVGNFNLRKNERDKRDSVGGNKLLRNDGKRFIDVSEEAGIYGSVIGFGLGVTVGDVNKDSWPDIYISNDFFERDYLYINTGNGTFKEQLTTSMESISNSSMGADLADINNDAWPDFFVTEMLPGKNDRFKSVTTFQNWDTYQYKIANGYHYQFTRNSLQLNNGDLSFSEISRLAGVEATDWSWGALIFDMNNDGRKDLFVANGIFKDLTNQDYLQYISNGEIIKSILEKKDINYQELIDAMPSNPLPDNAFENNGDFHFTDKAKEWGLGKPSFSNGSAYGDLDNDGDLDLVVNNVNMPAFIYLNQTEKFYPENRYLKFILKGGRKNLFAVGAKVTIDHGDKKFYLEQMPTRGFQSSVDTRLNIGLGSIDTVDRITVQWPYGGKTILEHVLTNQILHLSESDTLKNILKEKKEKVGTASSLLHESGLTGLIYQHTENDFIDFDRDHLIFHMLSSDGPRMCKGDVNGDGREDIFIGGAKDFPGALFIQDSRGAFHRSNEALFEKDKIAEDTDCVFFDADGDNDLDLYVASGGNEFAVGDAALTDRLYINYGHGMFSNSQKLLPTEKESTSCVKVSDYDKDGDFDLFVGARIKPSQYGMPADGRILNNNGKGQFTDVTKDIAPALLSIGMITDASWADVDTDGDDDLIIAGDWMPIKIFINQQGKFSDETADAGLLGSNGWWNRIASGDFDNDGDVDFVIGNHGLNSRFKGSKDKPSQMYVHDFDHNGDVEQIICVFNNDKSYPMVQRNDLVTQLLGLKKKYTTYEAYKDQTIDDIFTTDELRAATKLEAYEFQTSLILNNGKGKFVMKHLPVEAQFAPIFGLCVDDIDADGNQDILIGGNFYRTKPETGRYDASQGLMLRGDGTGNFSVVAYPESGWKIRGEVRDILSLYIGKQKFFLVTRNSDTLLVLAN